MDDLDRTKLLDDLAKPSQASKKRKSCAEEAGELPKEGPYARTAINERYFESIILLK